MHCSMVKFIVDAEQRTMAYRMATGINWNYFEGSLTTISDIGPGGHYLGHPHRLEHFQRAFLNTEMFDNNSIKQRQAEGGMEINERVLSEAKSLLQVYEEPRLDEAFHQE